MGTFRTLYRSRDAAVYISCMVLAWRGKGKLVPIIVEKISMLD
jgi:hypothetical protein